MEEEVLIAQGAVLQVREGDLMVLVVLLDQIENNGACLPDGNAGVGVLDCWTCYTVGDDGGFGEYVPGTRPLGLISVKGLFLTSEKGNE